MAIRVRSDKRRLNKVKHNTKLKKLPHLIAETALFRVFILDLLHAYVLRIISTLTYKALNVIQVLFLNHLAL